MPQYFDPNEALPRPELEKLQASRLKSTVERCLAAPFYKKALAEAKVGPDDIRTVDDVRRLPFTTKDDLRANYPYGMLALPREKFVRLHASSGTTGTPTAVFYTQKDLDTWASLMARSMFAVGVRPGDVLQNMSGYGLFTGGLGIHYGSERLGCLTIPAGAGNTKRQIKLLRDFGSRWCTSSPPTRSISPPSSRRRASTRPPCPGASRSSEPSPTPRKSGGASRSFCT